MSRVLLRLLFVWLAIAVSSAHAIEPAAATLVVFNSIDPLSESLAHYYAGKRGIPEDRVVGIACPMAEEITRKQYDDDIAEPLRKIFTSRGWWKVTPGAKPQVVANTIRFIALIRGVPLKISADPAYPGDTRKGTGPLNGHNEASVDSELAILGMFTREISGAAVNPYFRSYTRFLDTPLPPFMLVTRLDGPTGGVVRQMIDDSLKAERDGLWGFAYIDIRNITESNYIEGDDWLRGAAESSMKHGVPVVMGHGGSLFPESYPMTNAAFYYGWYTDQATGPFLRPDFRFLPGAVACHIHSYSALTIRSPSQYWAGPLLMSGAAAVLGNVYEPYLGLTTHLDIFQDRLLEGFSFAEAAYMSTPALSWMTTFIGDPLYRPRKVVLDFTLNDPPNAAQWLAFKRGAETWFHTSREAGDKQLRQAGESLASGEIFEGLAALRAGAGDNDGAFAASERARALYKDEADVIRTLFREANLLAGIGRTRDALKLLNRAIREHRENPIHQCLVLLREELDPPPAP